MPYFYHLDELLETLRYQKVLWGLLQQLFEKVKHLINQRDAHLEVTIDHQTLELSKSCGYYVEI
jgi:hypothetical protein